MTTTLAQLDKEFNSDQIHLITNSQEIVPILESLGIDEEFHSDITAIVQITSESGDDVIDTFLTEDSRFFENGAEFDIPDFWLD